VREAEEGTACHDEGENTESNVHDVMDDEDRGKGTVHKHIIKRDDTHTHTYQKRRMWRLILLSTKIECSIRKTTQALNPKTLDFETLENHNTN